MDNTGLFSGKADVYAKSRSGYPDALYADLCKLTSLAENERIADVGTGTGLFARGLLERGFSVWGVEPNADMREMALRELAGFTRFTAVAGDAADTTLPSASMGLVTAAQAFHWFDGNLFARECRRILRPGGRVALVWNSRVEGSAFVRENQEVFRRYCPKYHGFSGGKGQKELVSDFFRPGFQELHYQNDLRFDRERFLNRCLSASYSLTEGHPDLQGVSAGAKRML